MMEKELMSLQKSLSGNNQAYEAYPEHTHSQSEVEGEKGLLRAMLKRAADDLRDKDSSTRKDAERWFRDETNTEWGSFIYICSFLYLDPVKLRRETLRYRRRKRKE